MDTPFPPELPTATPDPMALHEAPEIDPKKEVEDTRKKFGRWAQQRKPFESAWFLNAAMLRGQQRVEYSDTLGRLVSQVVPASRIQISINRIRPKIVARLSKFFKNRPRPMVIPASADQQDILNARATEAFLTYQWYKQRLEEKYRDARMWASVAAKGFLWIRWDASAAAKVKVQSDPLQEPKEEVVPQMGDISIEVGSPFEIYPADNTLAHLGQQPEFIRARNRKKADLQAHFPSLKLEDLQEDTAGAASSTQKTLERLSTLNKKQDDRGLGGMPGVESRKDEVLVLEHFVAPCAKYPQGLYRVVVGEQLAHRGDLPHDFWQHPDNPYPVVEFADAQNPGQFWNTTYVEQMIDLQREYNLVRSMISENLRMMARPKIVVYTQHQLAEGAWTNAAGEIVELNYIPGLPPPQVVQPANIASDAWQLLSMIQREFDDLTLLPPAAMGATGSATSGYQTNLLQEAVEGAHAPDIRQDEFAIQELAWKMRKLAKLLYSAPRLLAVLGDNMSTEVMAFGQNQIDEFAEVRIQAGSMLPDLKTSRIQMITTMFKDGLFGPAQDPVVRKRVLNLLELGGIESVQALDRADKDEALWEEQQLSQGGAAAPAQMYQNHADHLEIHEAEMKSARFKTLPPEVQMQKRAHWITHLDFMNPPVAQGLRMQYNLQGLPVATPPMPPPPPPVGPDGQPLGAPPEGPPQGQAPPPGQPPPGPPAQQGM